MKFTPKNVSDYAVILQKPMSGINVLQILQGHFLGFHLRIPLSSEGIGSQVVSQKYLIENWNHFKLYFISVFETLYMY